MDVATVRTKYKVLAPVLTERTRRLWAASEALALGHGGIAVVESATAISRSTISRGMGELASGEETLSPERTRRPGGGRKRATDKDASLVVDLEALLEPTTSGDPDSPLRWTSKSVRHLAEELQARGMPALAYLTEIVHRRPKRWAQEVDRLHELLQLFGAEPLRRAFEEGLQSQVFSAQQIERILDASLQAQLFDQEAVLP